MTPTAPACPSDDLILAFADGFATPTESALIASHLDTCPDCMALLAEAGRGLASERMLDDAEPHRERGPNANRVGRYELVEVIGRGAFGVVFLAHDPDLDRKVAVKLVRIGALGHDAPELARRAILEAKAMARLSHPNVVTVHDVGTFEGGVYLAMELVEGKTLGAWLAAAPRTPEAIVEVFAMAGDGLAAAHEVGLVHRDFKPDNVLIAEGANTTRVLVTDFGLARAGLSTAVSTHSSIAGPATSRDVTRTVEGTVLGTPAYMAPEQLRGEPIDARADIFAFGLSLFEALAGERPFKGESTDELLSAYREPASMGPLAGRCKRRVAHVVERALALEPGARWPSMAALVAELRRDTRRRGWALFALAVIVGVAIAWPLSMPTHDARDACIAVGTTSARSVWGADRRDAVVRALEVPLGAELAARVGRRLDTYVDDWVGARARACDAVWVRGEQSEATLELRGHCLERRLDEFDSLTTLLSSGDAEVAQRAPAAASGLPGLRECESLVGLAEREQVPSEPWARGLSKAAEELGARAVAAELAGLWVLGAEHARIAALFAEASGDQRTMGEALTVHARMELLAGRPFEARGLFGRAIPISFRAGDDRGSAKGLIDLAYLLAVLADGDAEAHRLLDLAEALLYRLGGDLELEVRLRSSRAEVYTRRLDNARAIAEASQALELQARARGGDDPTLVRLWDALGVSQQQAELYSDALASFDQGLRVALSSLGPKHPETQNLLGNFGYCLMKVGRYREAHRVLAELYPQIVATFGASHWNPAIVKQMWALALTGLGGYAQAISWHQEGLTVLGVALNESPAQLAYSLVALAETALPAEEFELARTSLAEARRLTETHAPNNGAILATLTLHEASLQEALGEFAAAETLFSHAEGALLRHIGDGVSRAAARAGLARAAWRRGDTSAISTLREVLVRSDSLFGGPGPASARARFDLAWVLSETSPSEAQQLLFEAAEDLRDAAAEPELLAEILWLAARMEPEHQHSDTLLAEARALVAARSNARCDRLVAEGLFLDVRLP